MSAEQSTEATSLDEKDNERPQNGESLSPKIETDLAARQRKTSLGNLNSPQNGESLPPKVQTDLPAGQRKTSLGNLSSPQNGESLPPEVQTDLAARQRKTSLGNLSSGSVRPKLHKRVSYINGGFDAGEFFPTSRRSSLQSISQKKTSRRISAFTSSSVKQKFSEQEKKALSQYSSVNYAPTHSEVYMDWLRENGTETKACSNADRWFLVLLIGICVGLVATLLSQCLQALGEIRWSRTKRYIAEDNLARAWGWNAGMGVVYVLISSFFVTFIHPPAAGGGTPEVISFLNGIVVHGTLSLKNLIVKFIANVFAVSSGLPAAIQGPIISYGAIIGAGIGQFRSNTFGWTPSAFNRFRNAEDRRSFTTAGVAAGVAAAFNAPMGGLLFAMEDLSSFWSKRLSWLTFFCCVVSTAAAGLFNTAFTGFQFEGTFGLFSLSITEPIQIHVACLVPAIVLGLIGGLLGAAFTQLNRVMVSARKTILASVSSDRGKKLLRMFETVILVLIMSTYAVLLPKGFQCSSFQFNNTITRILSQCLLLSGNDTVEIPLERYTCPETTKNETIVYYSEAATLIQGSGKAYLDMLWSRSTHYMFDWQSLLAILAIWLFMTAWTAGSAIAGGIFVPTLVSGSLYGRAVGMAMLALWRSLRTSPIPLEEEWDWMDPGVMAVIGAGSLLSGVTRLALAATVIVVEMSHDIDLVIPVLIAILVAKFVADFLSKPLYKIQLEGKALPYLDQDPQVEVGGSIVNLELFSVRHVMSKTACTMHSTESVAALAKLLLETDHGAFPVVRHDEETRSELVLGLITRTELYVILCSDDVYTEEKNGSVISPDIPYEDVSVDYNSDPSAALERVKTYSKFPIYNSIFVNMEPFINLSAPKIDQDYSLHRTCALFRTLGLRHLIVTDLRNRAVGMITRKDIMPFNISEKLEALDEETSIDLSEYVRQAGLQIYHGEGSTEILPAITIITPPSPALPALQHHAIQEETEDHDDEVDEPCPPQPVRQLSVQSFTPGVSPRLLRHVSQTSFVTAM